MQFKVTAMMKNRMTTFVCDFFYGNTQKSDARKNLTTFPMELWKALENAILTEFLKSGDPIASEWAKDSDAALDQAKRDFKKIRQRLYNTFTACMKGNKGKEAAIKIASRLQSKLERTYKMEAEEDFNKLAAYTAFETQFSETLGIETELIRIGSDYGVHDCSNVLDCIGDILHAYMKYRKLQSWKTNCSRMIRAVLRFHDLMNQEHEDIRLPDTQLEFPEDSWSDDLFDEPECGQSPVSSKPKISNVLIIESEDDEEFDDIFENREFASAAVDKEKQNGSVAKPVRKRRQSVDLVETWRSKKPKITNEKETDSKQAPLFSQQPPGSPPPLEHIEETEDMN